MTRNTLRGRVRALERQRAVTRELRLEDVAQLWQRLDPEVSLALAAQADAELAAWEAARQLSPCSEIDHDAN